MNQIWRRRLLGVALAELCLAFVVLRIGHEIGPRWLLAGILVFGLVGVTNPPGRVAALFLGGFSARELGHGLGELILRSGSPPWTAARFGVMAGGAAWALVTNQYQQRPLPIVSLGVGGFTGYLIAAYLSGSLGPAPDQTLWIALLAVVAGAIGLALENASRRQQPATGVVGLESAGDPHERVNAPIL